MRSLRRARKAVTRNVGYGLALLGRACVPRLPPAMRLRIGEVVGSAVWTVVRKERSRALSQLSQAFAPEGKTEAELRWVGRECFRNLGRSFAELFALSRSSDPARDVQALVDISEGGERLRRPLSAGKGLVVVASHLDNWDLLGGAIVACGLPLVAVARRVYFEKYERLMSGLRRHLGMEIIYQEESPRRLLRALKDGKIVALLADHDVRRLNGVFVPFFGQPAYTPTGPVALALAARTDLVLTYLLREGRDRHRMVVSDPIQFDRSNHRQAILEGTRAWCALLEQVIRAHPEQWAWVHRRWRTRLADRPEAARLSGYALPERLSDES